MQPKICDVYPPQKIKDKQMGGVVSGNDRIFSTPAEAQWLFCLFAQMVDDHRHFIFSPSFLTILTLKSQYTQCTLVHNRLGV